MAYTLPQILILAEGGSPTLRPLTEHLPTCLVPVGGTPILDYQLQMLGREGASRVTVLGGYRGALVEQACRVYPYTEFRMNPAPTREEPRFAALSAAGIDGDGPLLVLQGDLVFDPSLLDLLEKHPEPDVILEDETGRGIGLVRLSAESARALLGGIQGKSGKAAKTAELFPFVESFLRASGCETIPVGERPWARVLTMEDLARAIKTCEKASLAVTARTEERLERSGARRSQASSPPAPDPDSTQGGRAVNKAPVRGGSLLARPLLKVLHR